MTTQKPRDAPSTEQIMESIGRIVRARAGGEGTRAGGARPAAPQPPTEDEDVLDLVDMVDERGNAIPLERAFAGAPSVSFPPSANRSAQPIAQGGGASEDRVLEALRPMLQTWLDTHMPPIVERLVRREIERAARRSEPE